MNYSVVAQASLAEASQEYLAAHDHDRKFRHRVKSMVKFYSLLYHARTAVHVGMLEQSDPADMQIPQQQQDTGYL